MGMQYERMGMIEQWGHSNSQLRELWGPTHSLVLHSNTKEWLSKHPIVDYCKAIVNNGGQREE